jgi:hypothetical protein
VPALTKEGKQTFMEKEKRARDKHGAYHIEQENERDRIGEDKESK